MVRVLKFLVFAFILKSNFSHAENPVLRDEAQKKFKRTRINSNEVLKAWADKSKKEVSTQVTELKKTGFGAALAVSSEAALANLKDEAFVSHLANILKGVERKDWKDVLADVEALLKQKNLKLDDLVRNPKIIKDYIVAMSEKEKGFWEKRVKEEAKIPLTESPADLSLPTGSFEDSLKLIKALSSFVKIESVEANPNNLLIRYFLAP